MGPMSLPPGFRFHPTDDELVGYYLKRKVERQTIELEVIPVVDLYKSDPWELPDKSFLPKRDMEWFFFCPRDKKYPNGSRTNRATASGYWKATGKDRKVFCESSVQGLRKTLVFYLGRAPGGERTDWVMHEYRLCEDLSQATPNFLGSFALCRVVKRNEHGLKTGDSLGECKGKRSFPSVTSDFSPRKNFNKTSTNTEKQSSQAMSDLLEIGNDASPITSSESGLGTEMQPIAVGTHEQTGFWGSLDLCSNPKDIPLEHNFVSEPVHPAPFPNPTDSRPSSSISPVSSYESLSKEASFVDELNAHGCFSPFPSLHHLSMYGNEENMGVQGCDWEMSRYLNTPFCGVEAYNTVLSPLIWRQASDVDEASLWLQETACWS